MTAFRLPTLLLALILPSCSAQNGQTQGGQTQSGQVSPANIPSTPPSGSPSTRIKTRSTAQSSRDPLSGLQFINVAQLPPEGQQMFALIGKGGPFRYSKDGVTFGNREGVLPKQARGYYREYTVKTPSERDRGARRIVCGGQPVTNTAECYYTADHYASFRRIRP